MFRKNRFGAQCAVKSVRVRLAVIAIALAGCWSTPAPREPLHHEVPRASAPLPPEPLAAEFGTFDEDGQIHPTVEIPLYAGSVFGWRLQLGCTRAVSVREDLYLPGPGDWGSSPDLTISPNAKAAQSRSTLACTKGWIENTWSASAGDPPGVWVLRVTADGFAPQTFRATFTPAPVP